MPRYCGPLLTLQLAETLLAAAGQGAAHVEASFDLGRTRATVTLDTSGWQLDGRRFPWPQGLKDRTLYTWDGEGFAPLQRYSGSLIKLVPTAWGPPTFEIDGIKMLPTAQVSPYADAARKVALVQPRGRRVLDTCGGLGYFAAWCLAEGAAEVHSFEKNADVLWLRQHNPWSPDLADAGGRLHLQHADISEVITSLPDDRFDAALHDPPRFGIAGELYSQAFYAQLARALRPRARLFHYTGVPNSRSSGRDLAAEDMQRLGKVGFGTERALDGVLATKMDGGTGRAPSAARQQR